MRVLVWGINYAPEVTGIGPCNADLCAHFRAAGHDVEMVTAFPYYPEWRTRTEDRGRLWRTDSIDGVPVHRCWHYVPAAVTRSKRILHEATFVLASLARVLTRKRPDLIIAVSPPLLLGFAAWMASALLGTRYLFHVQDLQPDAAVGLGMLKKSALLRLLYELEAFAYRRAWRVSGISQGMLAAFAAKQVPPEKCLFFPNGVALDAPLPASGVFRALHGFAPGDFLAVYSGNIGFKQGLESLVESARHLANPRIKIVICGDGAQRRSIRLRAEGLANVSFLPLSSAPDYKAMLADANLAVITQTAGSGRSFFPSKLLTSFAAALPVLSVADAASELARAIRESGGGVNALPNLPEELAAAIEKLAADQNALAAYGCAGRAWVEQFERGAIHQAFLHQVQSAFIAPQNPQTQQ